MTVGIGLVGCGTVGCGLLELLGAKKDCLKGRYGVDFRLVFATDAIKGTVFSKDGLNLGELAAKLARDGNFHGADAERTASNNINIKDLVGESGISILCEATPTNYKTGEPGMTIMKSALASGANVVTSSKGALGLDMAGLKKLARDNGVQIRFESSVMSGTPLINLIRGPLAGCSVTRVEGILNGTTNFILTRMEEGLEYAEALAEAQKLGYAEADPTGDVEGFDAAVKVSILAGEVFRTRLDIEEVRREGIMSVKPEDIRRAAARGAKIKLIAGAALDGGKVTGYVLPREVESSDPLASVSGVTNAVNIVTDNLGTISIIGPGAGKIQTAQGLISDMLNIASGIMWT
ncbi:MAG: homoserine dehydrogenase [Synergistaceae bacterium]|nr:homoserine dehydrogenase [Synergistaceae bacterium]